MLTPAQVIPFLSHDDRLVRQQAREYFDHCSDRAPLSADDVWPLIDRFRRRDADGDEEEREDEGLGYVYLLSQMPLTEPALRRLLREIESGPPERLDEHYQQALQDVDLDLMRRHRDAILNCPGVQPAVLKHLHLRLDLADQPVAVLYQRLLDRGRALRDADAESDDASEADASEADALIEALGRHGAAAGELAMETLADAAAKGDWREIFAVQVVGEARYEAAIAELVRRYDETEADILCEEVNVALARIGTPEVVEQIVAYFPGKPWEARIFAFVPLDYIKRPESEAALLKFAEAEEDEELRMWMLTSLCNLGSLAGLELAREEIGAGPEDIEVEAMTEALLATAVMNGVELPEAAQWRAIVEDRDRQRGDSFADLDAEIEELTGRLARRLHEKGVTGPAADFNDAYDDTALDDIGDLPRPGDVTMPIRREAPKVGRNDPCPCGSGKKYKKCCGNG